MQFNKRTMTAAFAVLAALMMIVIVMVGVPGGTDGEAAKAADPVTSDLITGGGPDGGVYLFANGTSVTIEADKPTGGTLVTVTGFTATGSNAYLVWTEKGSTYYVGMKATASVSGGSLDKSQTTTSVTMNGGSVNMVFGGSVTSKTAEGETPVAIVVDSASVTVNGGTVGNRVCGGGYDFNQVKTGFNTSISTFQNKTVNTTVTINGGTIGVAIAGAGLGYASVTGTATMTINGGTIGEIIAGGMNGYTANAVLTVSGATVKNGGYSIGTDTGYGLITTANRGEVAKATVNVLSLGAGSKAIITPGALSDATNTDGGCNAIVREVSLTVANGVDSDSVMLLMGIFENLNKDGTVNHNNPWDASSPDAPLGGASVSISAVGKTIEAYDLGYYDSAATKWVSGVLTAGDYDVASTKTWTISSGTILSIPSGSNIVNSGAIINSGTIEGKGSVTLAVTGAELDNKYGSTISTTVISDGNTVAFDNVMAGTDGMTITHGSLIISGAYTTSADGTITITGTATVSGTLESGVTLKVNSGGTLKVGGVLVVESGAGYMVAGANVVGATDSSILDIAKGVKIESGTTADTVVKKVSTTGSTTTVYKITLVADNGATLSAAGPFYVDAGNALAFLSGITVTVDEGYTFTGWFDAYNRTVTPSTVPTGDMTITAMTKKVVTPVTNNDMTNDANLYFIAGIVILVIAILALAAVILRNKK